MEDVVVLVAIHKAAWKYLVRTRRILGRYQTYLRVPGKYKVPDLFKNRYVPKYGVSACSISTRYVLDKYRT